MEDCDITSQSLGCVAIHGGAEPRHVLSAVIMTAPGTILVSKMLVPETEEPKTAGKVVMSEAVELAKKFSSEESGAFVNGILDSAHKSLKAN